MSVIFNSGVEAGNRTTNLVAGSSDYTCVFYVKMSAAGAGYRTAWMIADDITTPTDYVTLSTDVASLDLKLRGQNGLGSFTSSGVTLTASQWARVAYVRVGTGNRFYVNGVLIDTEGLSFSGVTFGEMQIGNDDFSDSGLEVAYFREWDTALTLAELNAEWFSTAPVLTGSHLITDTPLVNDLLDDSGNGNDWTAVGSLTFDATKPAFPANATRAAATAIASLPHTSTQNVWSEGLAYAAWFTYTATSDDDVISVWGYGDSLTPYEVQTRVYVGAGTTDILFQTSVTSQYLNKPTRFSVIDGTDYYIQFVPATSAPASAGLNIAAETFVQQTAPVGSIVVNDDARSANFPMGFYSSVDGDDYNVLTYVKSIAEGEGGDVLASGEFLLSSVDDGNLSLYNGDTSLITTIPLNIGARRSIRTCHGQGVFYVGSAGNPVIVNTIDETGAIGATTWTLTGVSTIAAIAASNDGTILYHSGTSSQAIKRWDLVNDVALSNFLPTLAGYQAVDILVLDDDTILISYQVLNGTGTGAFQVRHYDADAVLLDTYTFGTQGAFANLPCRMAYAIDDPNSFWVYLHETGGDTGISIFRNVKVSDGSTLAEVEQVEFQQGVYFAAETLTPIALFGNSLSCPFFISRVEVGPPSSDGTIIVTKVTEPSTDATEFEFTAGGGLSPTSFSLAHGGTEIFSGLTPDDGYAVEEAPNAFYQTTVEVSNGSPHTNITVGAGETVTVTFTNSSTFTPGFNTRPVKRRWLRRSPVFSKENSRVRHKLFQVDCLVGTGNANAPGDDPIVSMRYSDDGGHTWSYVLDRNMGARGHYGTQLQWWALGIARNRVYEIYGSDPVKVALYDAFTKVEGSEDSD